MRTLGRRRATRCVAALVALGATALGIPDVGGAEPSGVAVSPQTLIGFDDAVADCPSSRAVAVSQDRGVTWSRGDCFGSFRPGDPAGGSIVAHDTMTVVRIGADGHVTPLVGGIALDDPAASASGADGQTAFAVDDVLDPASFVTRPRLLRWSTGVGWTECTAPPNLASEFVRLLTAGPYVAVQVSTFAAGAESSTITESSTISASVDNCASWPISGAAAGRFIHGLTAEGLLVASGDGGGRDASGDWGATWAPVAGVATPNSPRANTSDLVPEPGSAGRRFVVLDRYSDFGAPEGWPAPPGTPAGDPLSGAAAPSLSRINSRFRRPIGLPDIMWNAALAQAAERHARYYELNPGTSGHRETRGRPGFSGVGPSDRCAAAGAASCGEVAHGFARLPDAVESWLGTPYHGLPFLTSSAVGLGSSRNGAVGNLIGFGELAPGARIDLGAFNGPNAALRLWPFDGATEVATQWSGGETPDPLTGYQGSHENVGPILFAWAFDGAKVRLRGPSGPVPLLLPAAFGSGRDANGTITADPTPRSAAPEIAINGWAAFFAARRLRPATTYTLTATTSDGTVREIRFRTASDPDPDRRRVVNPGVTLQVTRQGRRAKLVITAGRARGQVVTVRFTHTVPPFQSQRQVRLRTSRTAFIWPIPVRVFRTGRLGVNLRVTFRRNGVVFSNRVRSNGQWRYIRWRA